MAHARPERGDIEATVDFFTAAGRLQRTDRAGWLRHRGIVRVESVAEHSFRVALMASLGAEYEGLDQGKAMMIALVHDLAEASIGDITPADNVAPKVKFAMEQRVMAGLTTVSGLPELSTRLMGCWNEYAEAGCGEARLVKDCDKLDMWLRALEEEVLVSARVLCCGCRSCPLGCSWGSLRCLSSSKGVSHCTLALVSGARR
jgi:putative hydrolases of HD superfamily